MAGFALFVGFANIYEVVVEITFPLAVMGAKYDANIT